MNGRELLEAINDVAATAEDDLGLLQGDLRNRTPGDPQMVDAMDDVLVKLAILRRRARLRAETPTVKARVAS